MQCDIKVIKKNLHGVVVMEYPGKILKQTSDWVIIEAFFNLDQVQVGGMTLSRGDRFVEWYHKETWFNIFQVHDAYDGHLKGWYCNIAYPPRFSDDSIVYIDLALDLVVLTDGTKVIMDEQEYVSLNLPQKDQTRVAKALAKLQMLFKQNPDLDLKYFEGF